MNFLRRDELLFLLFWCSGYIGAKIGVPLSGTFTLLLYRYAIVVLLVAAYVSIRRQWHKPNTVVLLTGFLGHFIWLVAILKSFEFGMNAGAAALIAAMQPMLTALCAPVLLGEKNSAMKWFGIGLGFVGVCIFVSGDTLFGGVAVWVYLLPGIATISLTAITLLERHGKLQTTELPIMTSLFWQGAITFTLLVPLAWWFEDFHADNNTTFLFSVIWLALVVSISAYAMMFYLIRTRDATRVSALQYFVPPVTMVIAYLAFKEQLSMLGAAGLAVTLVGFYFMHRAENHTGG